MFTLPTYCSPPSSKSGMRTRSHRRPAFFALQRQFAVFMGNEGNLNLFPVFFYPDIPPPELDIEVKLTTVHEQNTIRVDYVDVAAVSAASVLQIGSSSSVNGKVRVMNIRQALGRGPLKMGAEAVAETKINPPV